MAGGLRGSCFGSPACGLFGFQRLSHGRRVDAQAVAGNLLLRAAQLQGVPLPSNGPERLDFLVEPAHLCSEVACFAVVLPAVFGQADIVAVKLQQFLVFAGEAVARFAQLHLQLM